MLPPEQRKSHRIEARCTSSDRELFDALLADLGLTEAELLVTLVRERAARAGVAPKAA